MVSAYLQRDVIKVIIVDLQKIHFAPKGFRSVHRMPMCGTVNHDNMDSGNGVLSNNGNLRA